MKLKEMRDMLSEQMKLVKAGAENIPQAETIANLSGKMIKSIQLQINSEIMKSKGDDLIIFKEIL